MMRDQRHAFDQTVETTDMSGMMRHQVCRRLAGSVPGPNAPDAHAPEAIAVESELTWSPTDAGATRFSAPPCMGVLIDTGLLPRAEIRDSNQ
jgi:hypothetical protein